ncbi:hypothetical protein SARC_11652, partial [Sphaeroforma arctica JP610]
MSSLSAALRKALELTAKMFMQIQHTRCWMNSPLADINGFLHNRVLDVPFTSLW